MKSHFIAYVAFFALLFGGAHGVNAQPAPSGQPELVFEGTGMFFMQPVWSPSGEQIAVTGSGYGGIWLMGRDGSDLRRITDAPSAGFGMAWSPDGTALLARVARYEDRRRSDAVALFDVQGERQLLTEYRSDMSALPQWSPDGSSAVLPSASAPSAAPEVLETGRAPARNASQATAPDVFYASDTGIRAAQPENSSVRTVLESRALNVTPSPDGSKIAYEVLGGPLVVVDADGANRVELGVGHRPSWSPDGAWIVFQRSQDDGYQMTAADLHAARADGSARVQLTDTPDRLEMNPAWSPQGDAVAFDDHEGRIWLLPVSE